MIQKSRLLVVDDEEVVCQGCRRIFSPQGFQVDTSKDPCEGLRLATERNYTAVLVDVRMPVMDGIQFLTQLRGKKPKVPVILITGYPSIPDAASAIRLGASDYVTKPFTPEDITRSVQRLVGEGMPKAEEPMEKEEPGAPPPQLEPWAEPAEGLRFWDQSWMRSEGEGLVRVGAALTPAQAAAIETLALPRVGEVVYQGLPLVGLTGAQQPAGQPGRTLPSPISGIVVAVNPLLRERPSLLWEDPFAAGWIASVSPTRLGEEAPVCRPRRVLLLNADQASAARQRGQLTTLGCQVRIASGWDELAAAGLSEAVDVLLVDADSMGEQGPDLVGRASAAAPSLRTVVVAAASSQWETAYRKHRIFYYAVEPFADNEIVEILDAVFRPLQQPFPPVERRKAVGESVSSIFINNRHGTRVGLLVAGGLLSQDEGLGWHVRLKLLDRLYPMRTASGIGRMTQVKLLLAASMCDRLLILLPKDTGRLPGSLVRDTRGEFVAVAGEVAAKVMALAVQPLVPGSGLTGFPDRTMAALAEHVVNEMAAC
jgi:DNA-binding response OmpR family regulator/glycine cleavage system H lipoate-binding protein